MPTFSSTRREATFSGIARSVYAVEMGVLKPEAKKRNGDQ
jgi:hypothetical protein